MKPTSVDAYVKTLPKEHAAILKTLRALIKKTAPHATEAFKWAQPVYEKNGPAIWIKAYTSYVNIGFWRGADIQDAHGLLIGEGQKMKHVKLESVKDINARALADYIQQAIHLNETRGDPTRRKK
ncbi:MAG: DUF1801 domain-containing protein [Chloroflexi bacterium]|nr:DUF1801 domain-containing protein [Chloroflexota bacterium]